LVALLFITVATSFFNRYFDTKICYTEGRVFIKVTLEAIDLDSYRMESQTKMVIIMEDSSYCEIDPVPTSDGGEKSERELDLTFSNVPWKDEDQVKRHIASFPEVVAKDKDYQNAMKNSDKQNAKIESQKAVNRAVINLMTDNMEIFKQYNDNDSFKKWLSDMVFNVTYNTDGEIYTGDPEIDG
jgi:type I restriction enzyme R subunit